MSDINTTPLVDVMLVLLIIFLVTVPVITQFLAWKIEGHHPTRRTVLGGVIAVAGVIALAAASGNLKLG